MNHAIPLPQYDAAQRLEFFLGDPQDPSLPFSYRKAVELDERDEYTSEACALLDEWGLNLYYLPEIDGGRLRTFEEVLALGRVVSRRDLSTIVEHSISFLGFAFLWLAGGPEVRRDAGALIQRGARIALGLTEREHGGDLVNIDLRASLDGQHYSLFGEKWLINNATRGEAITLIARTDQAGGFRGSSIFFVQKSLLSPDSYCTTPKILTHGIRGVDISGIKFDAARINADRMVGRPGTGLEIALKGLQVTRTMCANLSLGALDTALRIVLDFALHRRIYSSTVFDIATARTAIVDAFLDLLICDCVSTAATRALHICPEQMSLLSSIVKFSVPVTCDQAVQTLATVLGSRYYLRQEYWHGMYQKLMRDIAIVALFDGSTSVNLNIIASQLPALCSHGSTIDSDRRQTLKTVYDLSLPLPRFEPSRLRLSNSGRDDTVQAVCGLHLWVEYGKQQGNIEPGVLNALEFQLAELANEYDQFRRVMGTSAGHASRDHSQTVELFGLASRYCLFHSAAACVLFWSENRQTLGTFFGRGEWLVLALQRILHKLRPGLNVTGSPLVQAMAAEMEERFHRRALFSAVPLSCAVTFDHSR